MHVVGIDIGGTNTKIGVFQTNTLSFIEKIILSTQKYNSFDVFVKELFDKLSTFKPINGIGIGAPNGNFFRGTIEFAPNLPWKGTLQVVNKMKQYFNDIKIVLNNDANAAALGEMHFGKAKNITDFIQVTLGTGVGSGIVANGKLIYGYDGNAGEIGHTIYDPEGRQCKCGRRGCLETYASAGGLVKTSIELLSKSNKNSILRNISNFEAVDVFMAATKGDSIALQAFDITANILAKQLADCVSITSPAKIFVSGGLSNSAHILFEPLNKYFQKYLLPIHCGKVTIEPSGLADDNAGILGAVALLL